MCIELNNISCWNALNCNALFIRNDNNSISYRNCYGGVKSNAMLSQTFLSRFLWRDENEGAYKRLNRHACMCERTKRPLPSVYSNSVSLGLPIILIV